MPNEKVNDHTSNGWYTEVSWRRKPDGSGSGHVQLATVNDRSPFEFPEAEHGDSWEAGARFDGWRVTLDEAGIDRLIKALHKAKNQAFGTEPNITVTVESDATAAARLAPFVNSYDRTRRGDR